MDLQEELEITVPVSGELIREDMAAYFGVQFGGRLLDFVPSYENRRYRPVEYFKKIVLQHTDELVDEFRFLQSLTARPVKETITGPATLADWALIRNARYYKDCRLFRMDLARTLRKQIDGLVASSGVRILQVDEPALTTKRKNLFRDLEAIHKTIRGLEESVYLILHICYSDMEALDEAFPYILELPFHQIHMEMANRNYALMRLIEKYGFGGKDIGLGVVDVHTDRIETVEEIVAGVDCARQYFAPREIWLTPDCGLKERSDEVAKQKLRNMARAAEICRNRAP
jgi:5-methyltetrahydropteroyltriglutamate--homocysteine methyltransferase